MAQCGSLWALLRQCHQSQQLHGCAAQANSLCRFRGEVFVKRSGGMLLGTGGGPGAVGMAVGKRFAANEEW